MGARFVRLGIAGFKSFADAAALEILPGMTGVVGPNGCGKSNVTEALRWAMGESNVRTLRGGEMDDVIFAGTAGRASRNLAEVSLHVEGDEHGLPPPFAANAELQVVRRIERGGGSSYRVNGREARARDVQTLFADLASGSRSSAMVSQGRVSNLVSARPEDRRAVLEEAAGITGLHARRAEAETRLKAAEANLERAEERRALLERQWAGLQAQAKQAARYRVVMQAVLEAEAALLSLQRGRAQAACDAAATAMTRSVAEVQAANVAQIEAAAAARHAQASLPALREAESSALTRLERCRLDVEGGAADAARATAALEAARQRHGQLSRDLVHAEAAVAEADGAEARLIGEAARLRVEQDVHPAQLLAARAESAAAAASLVDADAAASAAATLAAEAIARTGALRQMLQQAEARLQRALDAQARADAERARALGQAVDPVCLADAVHAAATADRAATDARARLEVAEQDRGRATASTAAARDAHARIDAARHKLAAETGALAEVLAVKDGERWPPMVDRLVVPPGLEAALGAALGDELAAAEDPAAARHWRALPALVDAELPGRRMAEAVRAPPLLGRALGGVGLVGSDAEGDAAQSGLQPGQCLVSTAGAVWRWDGYTVRAGTPTAAAVRLRQRNRLVGLQTQLDAAVQAAMTARTARDAADRADRAATAAEHTARAARRDTESAAERTRMAARTLHVQAEAAAARVAAMDEQWAQTAPEAAVARSDAEAARAEAAAQPDPASLRATAEVARAGVAAARTRDASATRALDALHRAGTARDARLGSIARERDDRRMRIAELGGRVTDLAARLHDAGREQAHLTDAPDLAARRANHARAGLTEAEAAARAAADVRKAAELEAETRATSARSAEHVVFAARESVIRAEGAQAAALQTRADAEARIAERAETVPTLPAAPADVSAAAEDRARTRMSRLARERDDMGPVNLRADIEAEAVGGEIATIVREREELGTAIAKLRGSIGHLNREGRERLSAVFHQVDRHFQALFARMFGGGRAHLAMVGSDDPLLAGLEIYAQPPGKKLSALSLLSGGEQALTALSLIFAVFRCNPAPLCVLDEVDAPLDDANVDRFCALLRDMVQETGTRFLVVTHHQVTMARMDRLYGVTMQERGVSRLLSVDLAHAVGLTEAVAAE